MTANAEIQTCTNWWGDGLALFEMLYGGTRYRWHCFDCNEKGPAEVDGAVCRYQLERHECAAAGTDRSGE